MDNIQYINQKLNTRLRLSNGSNKICIRTNSPLNENFNKKSDPKNHLFYKCKVLMDRLSKIPGMNPFFSLMYSSSKKFTEQQKQYVTQLINNELSIYTLNNLETSVNSVRSSVCSDNFTVFKTNYFDKLTTNNNTSIINIFTFAFGILPDSMPSDPSTQIWKLFQQGTPLCLLFNSLLDIEHKIAIIGSDDLRICKKFIYDFLAAVKMYLNFEDDEIFTISNVFLNNTENLIKVMKVVNKILDYDNNLVLILDEVEMKSNFFEVVITDDYSKVFNEIIETERKYVQDLELMLLYKNELLKSEVIDEDQIHSMFPNIDLISDFQRKFLNSLECNINVSPNNQRIGSIFIHAASDLFKVYESWIIKQMTILKLLSKNALKLKMSSYLLDPGFELQSYILKPVQRVCKYSLLLKQLIKYIVDKKDYYYHELVIAKNIMEELAIQVNESQRKAENYNHIQILKKRVKNWKGFTLKNQGDLLYYSSVYVKDNDLEKEFLCFLFEEIIFFFSEKEKLVDNKENKDSKKILEKLTSKKKNNLNHHNSISDFSNEKKLNVLDLKGRIYVLEICNISSFDNNGLFLTISWLGKKESGSFNLRYKSEEARNHWHHYLKNLKKNDLNMNYQKKNVDYQKSNICDTSIFNFMGNTTQISKNSLDLDSNFSKSINDSYYRHHSLSSTFTLAKQQNFKSESIVDISSKLSSVSSGNGLLNDLNILNSDLFSSKKTRISLVYKSVKISQILTVPYNIDFLNLVQKIKDHIINNFEVSDEVVINKLKYKDDDGDLVVVNSDEDWNIAVDCVKTAYENDVANNSNINRDDNKHDLIIWAS